MIRACLCLSLLAAACATRPLDAGAPVPDGGRRCATDSDCESPALCAIVCIDGTDPCRQRCVAGVCAPSPCAGECLPDGEICRADAECCNGRCFVGRDPPGHCCAPGGC